MSPHTPMKTAQPRAVVSEAGRSTSPAAPVSLTPETIARIYRASRHEAAIDRMLEAEFELEC